MDKRVANLRTPGHCETFARNALERGRPDLAREAQRKAVELRAETHGAETDAEKECLKAIYAYEEILTKKNGRRTRASRTWQMIKRHGLIEAVERAVNRSSETAGYRSLVEMGLQDLAFEAIILRHQNVFSPEAIEKSKQRIQDWEYEET